MLGIIGAMENEIEQLCGMMPEVTVKTVAGMKFHEGKIKGKTLSLCALELARSMQQCAARFLWIIIM